jgi:hypothetical protein
MSNFKFKKPKHRKERARTRRGWGSEGKARMWGVAEKEYLRERYFLLKFGTIE